MPRIKQKEGSHLLLQRAWRPARRSRRCRCRSRGPAGRRRTPHARSGTVPQHLQCGQTGFYRPQQAYASAKDRVQRAHLSMSGAAAAVCEQHQPEHTLPQAGHYCCARTRHEGAGVVAAVAAAHERHVVREHAADIGAGARRQLSGRCIDQRLAEATRTRVVEGHPLRSSGQSWRCAIHEKLINGQTCSHIRHAVCRFFSSPFFSSPRETVIPLTTCKRSISELFRALAAMCSSHSISGLVPLFMATLASNHLFSP